MVATVTSTKLDEVVAQAAEASSTEATKGDQPKDTLSFDFFAEVATKMLEAQRKIDALNRDLASLRDQLAKLEFSNPGVTKQVEEARVANVERIFFAKQQRYHNLVSEAKELIKEGRDSDKLLAALEQLRYAVLDLKEKNDRLLASKAE